MSIFQTIILSIVEGITEFLPISSTAHLILASHLLRIPQTNFLSTFEIAIQLGSILAVVVIYFTQIRSDKTLLYKACIGFIPTGILGIILYDFIKSLFYNPIVPVVTLFLGGIAIIVLERLLSKNKDPKTPYPSTITYKKALLIGAIQSISMIPGVSRAAASIFGGMALGLNRKMAVEFAFLLAIPTMGAATFFDVMKNASAFSSDQFFSLSVGILISFITAYIVIKWLIGYVQNNSFIVFGVYRIILSILYYFLFLR